MERLKRAKDIGEIDLVKLDKYCIDHLDLHMQRAGKDSKHTDQVNKELEIVKSTGANIGNNIN